MGPQDFGTFILREQQKWGALARQSGAQAD
jgi:hypothetical protein